MAVGFLLQFLLQAFSRELSRFFYCFLLHLTQRSRYRPIAVHSRLGSLCFTLFALGVRKPIPFPTIMVVLSRCARYDSKHANDVSQK